MTLPAQTVSYPRADFVASAGAVNARTFLAELKAAALPALSVAVNVTDAIVAYSAVLDPSQESTAASVVTTHSGTAFASTIQRVVAEPAASDDSGSEVVRLTLDTGPLPAGDYVLSWYLELATTTTTGTTEARGLLYATKNAGARTERGQANRERASWFPMSGSMPAVIVDGDRYVFELAYQRIGDSGNAARVQRARLSWVGKAT